jgi:hypothetical protein
MEIFKDRLKNQMEHSQAISSGQVFVKKLFLMHILNPGDNLQGHLDHFLRGQRVSDSFGTEFTFL